VHLVGFYYKNISRCTVLWKSHFFYVFLYAFLGPVLSADLPSTQFIRFLVLCYRLISHLHNLFVSWSCVIGWSPIYTIYAFLGPVLSADLPSTQFIRFLVLCYRLISHLHNLFVSWSCVIGWSPIYTIYLHGKIIPYNYNYFCVSVDQEVPLFET